jgi:hypothetical protein
VKRRPGSSERGFPVKETRRPSGLAPYFVEKSRPRPAGGDDGRFHGIHGVEWRQTAHRPEAGEAIEFCRYQKNVAHGEGRVGLR